jgi:hypothetical protein
MTGNESNGYEIFQYSGKKRKLESKIQELEKNSLQWFGRVKKIKQGYQEGH